MINPQQIASMMGMNQQQTQKLTKSWQQAQQMASQVNNKNDAVNVLSNSGINNEFLTKVSGWVNNPMAGMIASAAGIDLNKVKTTLNALTNTDVNQATMPNPHTQYTSLDKLKSGLQQLKR